MVKKIHYVSATYRDDWETQIAPLQLDQGIPAAFDGMKAIMIQNALITFPK